MSSQVTVIERKWFVIAPDASGCEVALQVGVPSQEQTGDWSVVVSLVGLEFGSHKIYGVDSWQATILGMKFASSRVRDFSARGWQFYWEQGGEPATQLELGFGD
nr:hypothetical protein [Rhodoferax sp.]